MSFLERHKTTLLVLSLLVLYLVSVLVHLGVLEFAGEEPRRTMISVEMLDSGNFIKPTQYGWNYYNKPPVFNWILSFVIWMTGSVSEFVLRLPSLLFYVLMGFIHYRISRHFFPKQIALLSAFFLLTCADVYTYGLAYGVEIDIFYSFVVYVQCISIFWFYQKRQYLPLFLLSYFFCAIGFLTKAFPSLLFQVFTLGALCVYARSIKPLLRWQHLAGILLFFLVVGGYFLLYSQYSSPLRFLINLLNEAMMKSAVGEKSSKLVDKAIIYPWLFVKMFLPWSLLLLLLLKKVRYGFRSNPLVWFSILFIAFNIWVYWLTGQPKIRYVYMFLPFGCSILTQIYYRYTEAYPAGLPKILKYLGFVFMVPLLVVIAFPFYEKTSIVWVVILAIGFVSLLAVYYKHEALRIWWFISGYILLRLVYAALFVPLQRNGIESYSDHISQVVKSTGESDVLYWADAYDFSVAVNAKLFSYQTETIKMPYTLPLEIPYYFYRHTGKIIRFDTLRNNASYFISYEGQIKEPVDTIYSFVDRNVGQKVVFYKLKASRFEVE
ncbi:MAG: hypothetical protein EOO46_13120 [Flavobacterium sp.]|nr:MAG: hypothetical protein EOO46_13120 [Flavobacterium sp.]